MAWLVSRSVLLFEVWCFDESGFACFLKEVDHALFASFVRSRRFGLAALCG